MRDTFDPNPSAEQLRYEAACARADAERMRNGLEPIYEHVWDQQPTDTAISNYMGKSIGQQMEYWGRQTRPGHAATMDRIAAENARKQAAWNARQAVTDAFVQSIRDRWDADHAARDAVREQRRAAERQQAQQDMDNWLASVSRFSPFRR